MATAAAANNNGQPRVYNSNGAAANNKHGRGVPAGVSDSTLSKQQRAEQEKAALKRQQQQHERQFLKDSMNGRANTDSENDDDDDDDEDDEYDSRFSRQEASATTATTYSSGPNNQTIAAGMGKEKPSKSLPKTKLSGQHMQEHVSQKMNDLLGVQKQTGELSQRDIKFDAYFTPEELINQVSEAFTLKLQGDERMYQVPVYQEDGTVRYIGNPHRVKIVSIDVIDKRSECPFRLTYGINHIPEGMWHVNEKAKIGRHARFYSTGGNALDDIEPDDNNAHAKKGRLVTLWANGEQVDDVIFQVYSNLKEEDVTKGVTILSNGEAMIELPKKDGSNRATANCIVPWNIGRNILVYEKLFRIDYGQLLADAEKRQKIFIPVEAYEFAKRQINVRGITKAREALQDVLDTTMILGPPNGGKPGDFSGLREYLQKRFPDSYESMLGTKYHVGVDIRIVYAQPGISAEMTKSA